MNAPVPVVPRVGSGARTKPSNTVALRRANVLLEVSRRCAQTSSLDGILQVLVELTSRELDCDRGTLFLNDPTSGELFSRVAQGGLSREIRILNSSGIAGAVFQSGEALVIDDAYDDPRFNSSVDERTGYRTQSVICVPVRTMSDDVIGVMQSLNKAGGPVHRGRPDAAGGDDPPGRGRAAEPAIYRTDRTDPAEGNAVPRTGVGHQFGIRPVRAVAARGGGNLQDAGVRTRDDLSCTIRRRAPCSRASRAGRKSRKSGCPAPRGSPDRCSRRARR